MSYTLKKNLAHRKNYGLKRNTNKIKYIVIHYTGNDGDKDENNAKYFKSLRYVSSHYFVDSDSVTISVPDNYVAYAVGGSKYKGTKGAKYYLKCTNSNSISIELCDDIKNGKVYPSDKTIANAVELTKKLMKQYNIPAERVIRHYDVTGKACPAYWCGTETKDKKWKTAFHNKLTEKKATTKKKTVTEIAKEVMAGKYGNGHATRKKKIEALGYNYEEVRAEVNRLSKK